MSEEYLSPTEEQIEECRDCFSAMQDRLETTKQTLISRKRFTPEYTSFDAWADDTSLLKWAHPRDQEVIANVLDAIQDCLAELNSILKGWDSPEEAHRAAKRSIAAINSGICTLYSKNVLFRKRRREEEDLLRDKMLQVCRKIEALEKDVKGLKWRAEDSGVDLVKSVRSGTRRLITVAETLGWREGESEDEGYGSARMEG
jgi:hypothetical protein